MRCEVIDHSLHFVSATFVDMKFYLLFSFLFGYSFTLQLSSAERAGAPFKPRTYRRIGGLFVIGALHGVFLITGDILAVNAIIDLVLLKMRNVKDRTAIIVVACIYGYLLLTLGMSSIFLDTSAVTTRSPPSRPPGRRPKDWPAASAR